MINQILPQSVAEDSSILALFNAVEGEFLSLLYSVEKLFIYSGIEELDESVLDLLGRQFHIEGYETAISIENKVELIKESINIHRKKGTVGAIKSILGAAGYGDAEVIEGLGVIKRDGSVIRRGSHYYGTLDGIWAMWRIYLSKAISVEQANSLRKVLIDTAPVRCELKGIHFSKGLTRDGSIVRNGEYSRGVVEWQI